jgi:hypothetical protein
MQNATSGGASLRSDDRNDNDRSIASHLVTLIGQVQANIKLIESAIAREPSPGNQEIAANVIVLDDVTPRYAKAHAALSACSANLGVALHLLLDTRTSKHGTGSSAEGAQPLVRSTGCV